MSLGYADRLSHREDLGGRLGAPELRDAPHAVHDAVSRLSALVAAAARVVAFTGAGISTAAGIPDFRGPQGVWTLQRAGKPPPQLATSFVWAKPSLTHMALLGLLRAGKLSYVCSQNVDSLHLRSGVPRAQLAELHGNCFAERCRKCGAEYVRDFEMDTVGFKPTGRRCSQRGCRGTLADQILDWEDALPEDELQATKQHASQAGVALCLGTSLQIVPAANLPLRTVKAGGALAIVNLQATPKDKKASVVIHAYVDEVMALLMHQLQMPIPAFERTDRVLLSHTHVAPAAGGSGRGRKRPASAAAAGDASGAALLGSQREQAPVPPSSEAPRSAPAPVGARSPSDSGSGVNARGGSSSSSGSEAQAWGFGFTISSLHGPTCPLPMVASASVRFCDAFGVEVLRAAELSGQDRGRLPWKAARTCPPQLDQVVVHVCLQLVEAADADKRQQQTEYVIPRPPAHHASNGSSGTRRATRAAASQQLLADGSRAFAFVTQVQDYSHQQQHLVAELQQAAAASRLQAALAPVPQQQQQQQQQAAPAPDDAFSDDSSSSSSSGRTARGRG